MLKLRKLSEEDVPRLTEWMQADPYHREINPDIFFEQYTETLVFEDEHGPILFVNLARTLRAFVQFAPDQEARSRAALPEAFHFVKKKARDAFFRELIFESISPRVIAFCKKRLGFKSSPNEFRAIL
jgi:hypothetical protein